MKTQLLYLTFLIALISCSTESRKVEKTYSPISSWLINNEDTLAKQFSAFILAQNFQEEDQFVSREWSIGDSTLLGTLTDKIKLLDSNIIFLYQYRPQSIKKYALHINSDKKQSTIQEIDSLFNDIDSLKNFTIIKYNPPGGEFSKFIDEDEKGKQIIIDPTEIAFKLIDNNPKYVLSCFFIRDIPRETLEGLIYHILGDEIILKKLDTIKYFKISSIDTSMLSIKKLRRQFNITN